MKTQIIFRAIHNFFTFGNFLLVECSIFALYLMLPMLCGIGKAQAEPLRFGERLKDAVVKVEMPVKSAAVDIDRLAKAVALHETKDCGVNVGSARYLNCHGFKGSKGFYRFKTKQESYDKFKDIWTRIYGGGFPTLRLATTWVCGGRWPTGQDCPGGSPRNWLASVKSLYASL